MNKTLDDSPELRQLNTVRVLIRDDTKDWAPAVRSGALIALDKIESALRELIADAELKRRTGWVAPKDHYVPPVLFNPYNGEPRDVRDVQSDPRGILIQPPGSDMLDARKG